MSEATANKVDKCSKCGADRDTKGYPKWCKACRNKYQAEARESEDWRVERRGILRGILAMRQHIAAHFRQWAGRPFMGAEIGAIVDELPGPAVQDEDAGV